MGAFTDLLGLESYIPDVSAPRYTQDLIPVKKIDDGIITTKDDRYLKILKVAPINFVTLSSKEKDNIIYDFASWLSICPINMQIKINVDVSNPEKIVEATRARYERDHDEAVKDLVDSYCSLLWELSSMGAIAKHFYLIISLENKEKIDSDSFIEIEEQLNMSARGIADYFSKLGNVVTFFGDDIEAEDQGGQETWSLTKWLYEFFNPRTSSSQGNTPGVSFAERVQRIYSDTKTVLEDPNATPGIDSLIAPTGMDFNHPDCVLIDGKYYSYLVVQGDGYPTNVYAGWFDNVFSLLPGESIDIFIHKESRTKMLVNAGNKMKFTGIKLDESNENQINYEKIENALDSAKYIKNSINNGGEDPFYVTTLITISAFRYDDLIRRKDDLIDQFKASNIALDPLRNVQEEAMKSSFPFLYLAPKIYSKGKRNIMTLGLASFYPFTSEALNNSGGFVLGVDSVNGALCVINPFDTTVYKNANMIVLGSSGAGKTYTLSTLAMRMRMLGKQCFIVAPEKAHEFSRLSRAVGGSFIKIAASSTQHMNIMDIRPKDTSIASILQGSEEAENMIYVSDKASTLVTFFGLLGANLSPDDEALIDSCVVLTYKKKGITQNNDSIYIDPEHKEKGLKEMPILQDLYETLRENHASPSVMNAFSKFITGSAQSFNAQTNVDLDNKMLVFDVSSLEGNLIAAGMFVVLDFIMGKIKEDITRQKMVFIDEAWRLIGSGSNAKAADYVNLLVKTIRGYSGGTCISTQNIGDYFALENGKYGKSILSNSQIKLLLGHEPEDAEFVADVLGLNDFERRSLTRFDRGQCLVCARSNHIPLNVRASYWEHNVITSEDFITEIKNKRSGGMPSI